MTSCVDITVHLDNDWALNVSADGQAWRAKWYRGMACVEVAAYATEPHAAIVVAHDLARKMCMTSIPSACSGIVAFELARGTHA